MINSISYHRNV